MFGVVIQCDCDVRFLRCPFYPTLIFYFRLFIDLSSRHFYFKLSSQIRKIGDENPFKFSSFITNLPPIVSIPCFAPVKSIPRPICKISDMFEQKCELC